MRKRWSLVVMPAGALTFLASLYLPWKEEQSEAAGHGVVAVPISLSFRLLCSWLRKAQGSTRVGSELLLLPWPRSRSSRSSSSWSETTE